MKSTHYMLSAKYFKGCENMAKEKVYLGNKGLDKRISITMK